jgi:hypothetical protein
MKSRYLYGSLFEQRIIKNPNEYKFSNTFRNNILKTDIDSKLKVYQFTSGHRDSEF